MVGCVGNAPTLVRLDIRFTGGSRSLRGYQPEMVAGRGMRGAAAPTMTAAERSLHGRRSVNRTTIGKLMRLPGFSTFPRFEMVDRHGFAPCSPACEASDLLNDRAAHEIGGGGGNRTRS